MGFEYSAGMVEELATEEDEAHSFCKKLPSLDYLI